MQWYIIVVLIRNSLITSWQIDEETVETVADFIFGGSKIIADGDCNHEIKRRLLLGRKFMTNLDSILKSRDITLPTKVHLVKAMVFPVVMYGYESWTIKKWTLWKFSEAIQRKLLFIFLKLQAMYMTPRGFFFQSLNRKKSRNQWKQFICLDLSMWTAALSPQKTSSLSHASAQMISIAVIPEI